MNKFESVEILLVEDSDTDAEMTLRAMKKQKLANKVTRVKDGVEAMEFISCTGAYAERQDIQPRLILLDLKMPRMDGIAVLKSLKSDEKTRMIPVVVLTSSAEESDMVESYHLGVNSYLVKPVDFAQFIDVVSQAGLYWAVLNALPR